MRKSIQTVQAECERLRARMVDAEREKDRQCNRAEDAEAECERHRSERDVESRLNRDRVEALQSECDVAQDEARKATARADDAERRADNLRASHDYPRLQDVARIGELEAECERRRARERELVAALALADKVMADTVTEERRLLSEERERLRAALRKHAGHSYECANGDEPVDDCICGYDIDVPPLLTGVEVKR